MLLLLLLLLVESWFFLQLVATKRMANTHTILVFIYLIDQNLIGEYCLNENLFKKLLSPGEIKVKTDIETLKLNIERQFTISAG